MNRRATILMAVTAALGGCASLGGLGLQPPSFSVASTQDAEIRLMGPSLDRPLGGATLRLYARVANPNPIGLVLSRLRGNLALEGTRAAEVDFPLGVPLDAGEEAIVPLDVSVSFSELPGLADVVRTALSRGSVGYSLSGTVGVDAGVLGQPTFGPMLLLEGDARTGR